MMNSNREQILKTAVEYHLKNKIPFTENVFKAHTELSNRLFAEAKLLYATNKYTTKDPFERQLLESDIGQYGMYRNKAVPLDFPMKNKSSKLCVYVKDYRSKIKKLYFKNEKNAYCFDKMKSNYWSNIFPMFLKYGGLNGTSSMFL
jgi:hypothetical protein